MWSPAPSRASVPGLLSPHPAATTDTTNSEQSRYARIEPPKEELRTRESNTHVRRCGPFPEFCRRLSRPSGRGTVVGEMETTPPGAAANPYSPPRAAIDAEP